YRTTDGGEHWTNVGLKDSRAITRIVVDPKNPDVAYVAAMGHLWADGGERGLYNTTDGGKTWKLILQAAAPHNARTGCGDVTLDPTNPQTVYATLYPRQRTPWSFTSGPNATGDEDWTRMSAVDPRPFYFSQIRVDPANDQRVYLLQFALLVSDDGGKNFREDLSEKVHPDCHALAIQPGTVPAPKPPKPEDKNK